MTVVGQTRRVFLADAHDGIISVLDGSNGTLLHTVRAQIEPLAIVASSATNQVFVANTAGQNVLVLDARSGALLHSIRIGGEPQFIAIDPRTGHAFVSGTGNFPNMFDVHTNRILRILSVDAVPAQLGVDQFTHRVFLNILSDNGGGVVTYDTRTGNRLHKATLVDQPISTPIVDNQTGHILVLLQGEVSATRVSAGQGMIVALDATTGVVRRSIGLGNVYGGDTSDLLVVDERTQRAFASTGNTVVVLDATRL